MSRTRVGPSARSRTCVTAASTRRVACGAVRGSRGSTAAFARSFAPGARAGRLRVSALDRPGPRLTCAVLEVCHCLCDLVVAATDPPEPRVGSRGVGGEDPFHRCPAGRFSGEVLSRSVNFTRPHGPVGLLEYSRDGREYGLARWRSRSRFPWCERRFPEKLFVYFAQPSKLKLGSRVGKCPV